MAAIIVHLHAEIGVGFFRRLHGIADRLTSRRQPAPARVGVQHKQRAFKTRREQTRRFTGGFFIAGQGQDQIALGPPILSLQADECGHKHGEIELVVVNAAAEEIGFIFCQRKWRPFPIFGLGVHHIHVRGDDDGRQARVAPAQPGDESRGVLVGDDLQIRFRKTAGQHGFAQISRISGYAAAPFDRIKRDRSAQDFHRLRLRCLRGGERRESERRGQ